jgi:hypothetical protein
MGANIAVQGEPASQDERRTRCRLARVTTWREENAVFVSCVLELAAEIQALDPVVIQEVGGLTAER